ncbi:MAG: patatin [Hydrocarboniphaga sp.]|uniref:patatin-like phospholipase family protein n=1 Tax=Hydrocarboniphaga sp. TaxID=2033016 RepID=UPI00260BED92|nr:patatin-like phospholipase family protein [Hydrocarboniphaga sp.]MDB5970520.1 patatin [Hydrocarboniphaga sp.]
MSRPLNKSPAKPGMNGLVLTAGGARGAYQAGVLKRIGEVPGLRDKPSPFPIIAGASAGAINGAAIATFSDHFGEATERLAKLWSQLKITDVVRTDTRALVGNVARIGADFAFGGVTGAGRTQSLLDASPLLKLLTRSLPANGISEAIAKGHVYALAITATGYHSGRAFTFIEGREGHPVWQKSRRVALPARITPRHVCASAAIPIVFQPVPLAAAGVTAYFGDGAMRLTTPLSPAIRLGADKLFAIGIRSQAAAGDLLRAEMAPASEGETLRRPPLSQICGVFLNAIFLDHLDADLEHLTRMNELVAAYLSVSHHAAPVEVSEPMRIVHPLSVAPSEDLAVVAKTLAHRMPRTIRYAMDGLGTPDAQSADLLSYLLFDSAFTRELIAIGYRDANARIDEIEAFLRA